uniref:Uncharacterized protein n=1 Tax=Setaria viridis TaxID=4556 RepID=A0A4U6TNT1_SETVI|nr:hypothetical protein SEVIR_8G024400v2 [Setaria viridis]
MASALVVTSSMKRSLSASISFAGDEAGVRVVAAAFGWLNRSILAAVWCLQGWDGNRGLSSHQMQQLWLIFGVCVEHEMVMTPDKTRHLGQNLDSVWFRAKVI